MFVATNRLTIKAGFGQELEQHFGRRGGVEQQPGFLGFELWKREKDADHEEYLVVTRWESKEAQQALGYVTEMVKLVKARIAGQDTEVE
jgi:heme-degrading monooxygenase HmoA